MFPQLTVACGNDALAQLGKGRGAGAVMRIGSWPAAILVIFMTYYLGHIIFAFSGVPLGFQTF